MASKNDWVCMDCEHEFINTNTIDETKCPKCNGLIFIKKVDAMKVVTVFEDEIINGTSEIEPIGIFNSKDYIAEGYDSVSQKR